MTADNGSIVRGGNGAVRPYQGRAGGGPQPANLGDILERVLDTGIVIAGDIRVNLLDIELLTIKLRLVIASVDTARQLGIDWWQSDPWLSSKSRENARDRELSGSPGHRELPEAGGDQLAGGAGDRDLADENRRLRARLAEIEGADSAGRPREGAPARDQVDTDE